MDPQTYFTVGFILAMLIPVLVIPVGWQTGMFDAMDVGFGLGVATVLLVDALVLFPLWPITIPLGIALVIVWFMNGKEFPWQ